MSYPVLEPWTTVDAKKIKVVITTTMLTPRAVSIVFMHSDTHLSCKFYTKHRPEQDQCMKWVIELQCTVSM